MAHPSFLDRARSRIASGLGPFARAIGGPFAAAPQPFSGQTQPGPANLPPQGYLGSDPAPPPDPLKFVKGYHDRTLSNWAGPINFGGRTLEITRADIEAHDAGTSFLGSSIFAVAASRFPTVFSALGIRCAPGIALPRRILGGTKGIARVAREEVEEQLCPRLGLEPSPMFPGTLWGTIAFDLAMMGFAVLQHVYGPPDERGVRRVYTRRWPTWAVYYLAQRRTYVAMTNEGVVDISTGDGKFTLIGKSETPHHNGAVRALMLPVLDGVQTIQCRSHWIDAFSSPKVVGELPPDIAARSDIGRALYAAIATMRGPGGFGVVPHGSNVQWVGLDDKASKCFADALRSDDSYINQILTGVDTGSDGGVYKPLVFWGILRSTVGDDLAATNRGINQGHVRPYAWFNYEAAIEDARARGLWEDPVLDTPLPDPEADARAEAAAKRQKALSDQVKADAEAGGDVDQDRVDELAALLEARPFRLASRKPRVSITDTDRAKAYRVREVRAGDGYEPIGDERDDLTLAELEAIAKQKAQANQAAAEQAESGEGEGSPGSAAPAKAEPKAPEDGAEGSGGA